MGRRLSLRRSRLAFRAFGPFLLGTKLIGRQRENLVARRAGPNFKKRFSIPVNLARQQQVQRIIAQGFAVGELHDGQAHVEMLENAFFAFPVVTGPHDANGLSGLPYTKILQGAMGIHRHLKLGRVRDLGGRHNRGSFGVTHLLRRGGPACPPSRLVTRTKKIRQENEKSAAAYSLKTLRPIPSTEGPASHPTSKDRGDNNWR